MSAHESDSEFFRLVAAMYGLAHYNHIVDAVRTISYFLLCLLSLLVYNFNVLVLCFKWTLTEVYLWISFSKLRLRHDKSILNWSFKIHLLVLSLGACLCGCLLYRNILIQLLEKFATLIFSDYLASNIRLWFFSLSSKH